MATTEASSSSVGNNNHNSLATTTSPLLNLCPKCHGEGRLRKSASRKARMRHKRARRMMSSRDGGGSNSSNTAPPEPRWEPCWQCDSSGLVAAETDNTAADATIPYKDSHPNNNINTSRFDKKPHVVLAIVGGGLGGLALAVACRHRSIPCVVYERDAHFSQRSQGYGLTLQQASRALKAFGIILTMNGITSTKHVVHTTDGTVVGEWGMRKWRGGAVKSSCANSNNKNKKTKKSKRQNIHIARQSLRWELLLAMGGESEVQWNCQLVGYQEKEDCVEMTFRRGNSEQEFTTRADVLVGADGIRSTVRKFHVNSDRTPLRYLGCIVCLGICSRQLISSDSPLLDGETVFQTADGTTRLYAMPYSSTEYMWQLSFPMEEEDAIALSRRGASSLQQEALLRCGTWHDPIPKLLSATPEALVSGYPVYDRELLTRAMLPTNSARVTLLGDAAHPMSPFKGQGANQALLDALALARSLYREDDVGNALRQYEEEMLTRSADKVKASAEAANFLHSDVAIRKGNVTRGGAARDESKG